NLLKWQLQVRDRRAVTTSGTGDRVGPTSNDGGDPSPIAAGLFANADRAPAPPETVGLRSPLWAAPKLCRTPRPSTRHRGLTDGDQSLARNLSLPRGRNPRPPRPALLKPCIA